MLNRYEMIGQSRHRTRFRTWFYANVNQRLIKFMFKIIIFFFVTNDDSIWRQHDCAMKLPRNLSCVKILTGRVTPTSEGNWETLEVKVGNEIPDGLYALHPRTKYVIKRKECLSSAHAERIWSLVRVLSNLSHPNIVCYFGSLVFREELKTSLLIPCEFFPKGSLLDLLVSERALYGKTGRQNMASLKLSMTYLEQICRGLVYLHDTMKMVHGNLRPANILIGNDGICRLTDISLRLISESASSDPLTDLQFRNNNSEYSPPELFAYDLRRTPSINLFTSAGDMFAVGCVLTELLTGVFIHERITNQHLCFGVDAKQMKKAKQEIAELFFENEHSPALTLSSVLLEENPTNRPTASKTLFLMSKKPEQASCPTSILSLNGIAIEPFVVPRSACQLRHKVGIQAPEIREDEDIFSFFENMWGDSHSFHSGLLLNTSPFHIVEPKALGSNVDAIPSGQVMKKGPQISQPVERFPVPEDENNLHRRQALSMRLCADALELQSLDQLDGAEQKFKTAIAASAKHTPAKVLFEYGCFLLSRKQDIGGAESMWVRSIAEDPKHVPSLYALAKLKVNFRDDQDSAEELLKRVIDLDRRHADALRSVGILLINKGFNFEGETMLKRSLAVDPRCVETMITYGWLLHKGGRIEEAENLYLKALSHDEENSKVLSLISLLFMDKDPPPWQEMNGCAVADQETKENTQDLKSIASRRQRLPSKCATSVVDKAPSLATLYLEARNKTLGSNNHAHESHVKLHDDSRSSCSVKTSDREESNSLQVCYPVQKVDACRNDVYVGKQHVIDLPLSKEDCKSTDRETATQMFRLQTSAGCVDCPHQPASILCAAVMKYRTSANGLFSEYCVECLSSDSKWHVWRRFSDFDRLQAQVPICFFWNSSCSFA
jgi:serine/threonine protein kinase